MVPVQFLVGALDRTLAVDEVSLQAETKGSAGVFVEQRNEAI
jgi:hypothetical protein